MPPEGPEYELSVEQELPAAADGAPRRARLTARWPPAAGVGAPELGPALHDLIERLSRAVEAAGVGARPSSEGRPDRALSELLETYRPRQAELVELLHADGEISDGEFELLRRHVAPVPPGSTAPGASPASGATPGRSTGRPVEELLRVYQIASLRQAGAVRARRQISFEEYMSLKRHFSTESPGASEPPSGA